MEKNRVKLNICGTDYVVLSEESETYIKSIATEIDQKMSETLKDQTKKSLVMAATLAAMDYCDKLRKEKENNENAGNRVKEYLEMTAKSQIEKETLREENEILKEELEELKRENEELKEEIETLKSRKRRR